jgi:hypothetical protein
MRQPLPGDRASMRRCGSLLDEALRNDKRWTKPTKTDGGMLPFGAYAQSRGSSIEAFAFSMALSEMTKHRLVGLLDVQ